MKNGVSFKILFLVWINHKKKLQGLLEKTKIDPKLIQDVQVGNVLPNGGGATIARMAQLYAG